MQLIFHLTDNHWGLEFLINWRDDNQRVWKIRFLYHANQILYELFKQWSHKVLLFNLLGCNFKIIFTAMKKV